MARILIDLISCNACKKRLPVSTGSSFIRVSEHGPTLGPAIDLYFCTVACLAEWTRRAPRADLDELAKRLTHEDEQTGGVWARRIADSQ